MTPQEIDRLEFRRESAAILERALAYAAQKRAEERAHVKAFKLREAVCSDFYPSRLRALPKTPELSKVPKLPAIPKAQKARKLLTSPKPSRVFAYDGKLLTIKELSGLSGISRNTIQRRIAKGLPMDLVMRDFKSRGRSPELYFANGLSLSMREWSEQLGISVTAVCYRLRIAERDGLSLDAVLVANPLPRPSKRAVKAGGRSELSPVG